MDRRRSLTNALWLMGQPLVSLVCLPATTYVIRCLGPLHYGQWAVALSLVSTTAVMTDLGLRTVFVRSVAQEPAKSAEGLAEQLGLRAVLALLAGAIALLLCLGLGYPRVVLLCVAIWGVGGVISALASAAEDLLHGFQRLKSYAVVGAAAGLVLTTVSALAAWWGAGIVGITAAYLSGPITSLGLLLAIVRKEHCAVRIRWNLERYRELIREARALGACTALFALRDRIEQLLVPKLTGVAPFGYFAAGSLVADRLTYVPDSCAAAFYPVVAQSYPRDPQAAAEKVSSSIVLSLVMCVPAALLAAFLAEPLGAWLFRGNAALCGDVIRTTLWAVPLLGVFLPMISALQAAGKFTEVSRAGVLASGGSVAITILLASHFGIRGACWAWVARWALLIALLAPSFIRAFPAVVPRMPLGRIAACAAAMAIPLWYSTMQGTSGVLGIGVGGCVGGLAYVAALIGLRVVAASELARLLRREPSP